MKNQFETLREWIPSILQTIKREIKGEKFPSQQNIYKAYFGNRPQNRLTTEEIFSALQKELMGDDTELQDWVINRWVFRSGDLYTHFADRLSRINPDFSEIKSLSLEESEEVLKGAVEGFGAAAVYLFSVLNGVVFPESVLSKLKILAETERGKTLVKDVEEKEKVNLEQILELHKREFLKLEDKFESKLAGVLKKYSTDVEALKKQIRSLQKQVSESR